MDFLSSSVPVTLDSKSKAVKEIEVTGAEKSFDGVKGTKENKKDMIGIGSYASVYVMGEIACKFHNSFLALVREKVMHSYLRGVIKYNIERVREVEREDGKIYPWDLEDSIVQCSFSSVKEYHLRMRAYDCDLASFLKSGVNLTLMDKEDIILDILMGLYMLHSFGIVHNDISFSNIFIRKEDNRYHARLGDLGSSQPVGGENPFMTTRAFSSKDSILTQAHDMYGLGAIISSLWNDKIWFSSCLVKSGSILYEDPVASSISMDSLRFMDKSPHESIIYIEGSNMYIPPISPSWRSHELVNAGGVNIGGLPMMWQDVVISLRNPERILRPSARSIIRRIFNVNVHKFHLRSTRRSIYAPESVASLSSSPSDNLIREIKKACSPIVVKRNDCKIIKRAIHGMILDDTYPKEKKIDKYLVRKIALIYLSLNFEDNCDKDFQYKESDGSNMKDKILEMTDDLPLICDIMWK